MAPKVKPKRRPVDQLMLDLGIDPTKAKAKTKPAPVSEVGVKVKSKSKPEPERVVETPDAIFDTPDDIFGDPDYLGAPAHEYREERQSVLTDEEFEAVLEQCLLALPDKFTGYREHQRVAIRECLDALATSDVVILDAPTGSGKTLIAETLRLIFGSKATYICNNKGLQDQFVKDFPYAKVLKGRSNYQPTDAPPFISCADCDKEGGPGLDEMICTYCSFVPECPYEQAKMKAVRSKLAVINTAYMLAEANYVGDMSGRDIGILDECDTLENELMGFVEFRVSEQRIKELGIEPLKKGVHKPTIRKWLIEALIPAIKDSLKKMKGSPMSKLEKDRKIRGLTQLAAEAARVASELDDLWVRDYERVRRGRDWTDSDTVILKPVKVTRYGHRDLWQHADKWIAMSATVVSAEEFSDSLGIEEPYVRDDEILEGLRYEVVRVPMTFPAENRPVYFAPIAKMSRAGEQEGLPKLLDAITLLCKYRNVRTLIHAHKYALANDIVAALSSRLPERRIVTYRGAHEKDAALNEFSKYPGAILVAVSMDRGVDLPDDLLRLQIMAKVPFPYLGDKQVSEREKGPGGKAWYATQTARVILQACGRGVRHVDDWCETWILDQNFGKFYQQNKGLFPEWWREGFERVHVRDFERRVTG